MKLFEMKYGAKEFATLTHTSTDTLRDWRRRGFNVGIDAGVNGRKSYCDYDRLEVHVLAQLRKGGLDSIQEAFEAARHIAPSVVVKLGLSLADSPEEWMRNGGRLFECKYGIMSSKGDYSYTSDINHFMVSDAMASYMRPVFTAIDIDCVAESVREWVETYVLTGEDGQ